MRCVVVVGRLRGRRGWVVAAGGGDGDESAQHVEVDVDVDVDVVEFSHVHASLALGVRAELRQERGALRQVLEPIDGQLRRAKPVFIQSPCVRGLAGET